MKSLLFIILFLSAKVWATLFVPQPLSRQMSEASFVIQGQFLHQTSYMLGKQIVTESVFDVSKALQGERLEQIKVLTPGGQIGDLVQAIDGVPVFKKNEEVVLLLKSSPQGYWVHNLALGKYLVLEKDGKKILHSEIFPSDKNLSKIPYSQFEKEVERHFKKSFVPIEKIKVVPPSEILKGSANSVVQKTINQPFRDDPKINFGFLALIFFFVLFVIGVYRYKGSKRE